MIYRHIYQISTYQRATHIEINWYPCPPLMLFTTWNLLRITQDKKKLRKYH